MTSKALNHSKIPTIVNINYNGLYWFMFRYGYEHKKRKKEQPNLAKNLQKERKIRNETYIIFYCSLVQTKRYL